MKAKHVWQSVYHFFKKRLRLGVDVERVAYDLMREFSEPFVDEGSVRCAFDSTKQTLTVKIGRREVTFDKYMTIVGTGTDYDSETAVYCDMDSTPYEVAIQKRHLNPVTKELVRLMARTGDAHPETWYRFTINENSRLDAQEASQQD